MTDDVRNLLGGYATGTLTEAEQKQLFEAALHDESLFAALADEEVLRELLADPAARQKLLRTVAPAKKLQWSVPIAIAAMLVVTTGIGMVWLRLNPPAREMAMSLPKPALSEPARPEAERQQPRPFVAPVPPPPSQRTPPVAPPPAAIHVDAQQLRLKLPAPAPETPPASPTAATVAEAPMAIPEREQGVSADMAVSAGKPASPKVEAARLAKTAAERVQHRIVEDSSGTRVILTPVESGTLLVVGNTASASRIIVNTAVTAGVEQTTPILAQDVTELLVTLSPPSTVGESKFAARSTVRKEAEQDPRRSPTLRIVLPKKK